ncbi:hypothetical protein P3547_19830 [Vibrio parahaemolyticus]|nr:hypothetical protein [Vibrio parahaemolyticus]
MTSNKQHLISCDPGISGAFAVFNVENKELLRVENLPKTKDLNGNNIINSKKLLEIFSLYDADFVCEHLWAMNRSKSKTNNGSECRKDTPVTAFSLGRTYQSILMTAELAGCEVQTVAPVKWKGDMSMKGLSKEEISAQIAARFPEHNFKKRTGTWKHDKAEAVAIGLWALEGCA